MEDYVEALKKTLILHQDEYIDYLNTFVSIDTRDLGHGIKGGYEANGQEYLKTIFVKAGADNVEIEAMTEEPIQRAMHQYNEGNPGHNYENRYNLYGFFTGQHERSIMFNGHIDTLPPENEDSWSFPPLSSFIREGRIYGLGVCDMKAGLMAATLAVKLLKDAGIPLPCKVIISSVCDEEGGGNGSIVAAMGGLKADAVVVCEPTTRELILAHMGWVFFQIEADGIAVHSGLKKDGVSAIAKAYKLIKAIDELEHQWLLVYKHPLLPPPSSNVGVIQGGDAGSTVPNYCIFKTCVHYHPVAMNHKKVVNDYMHAIELCCDGDVYLRNHKPKVTVYQSGGGFEMDREHPLVACFTDTYKNFFNMPVTIAGSPAGCDSRTWKKIAGCPTIQYGPGALHQSHAVDEYVEIQDYLDAILIYAGLILSWGNSTPQKS